jgi:type I restriction-modification system DNA methylase subunit
MSETIPMQNKIDTQKLADTFSKEQFKNEDDIKIKFYSHIASPILSIINPLLATTFSSEKNFIGGGRADAVFQNIAFEYKQFGYFEKGANSGINEVLRGRDKTDSGLYEHLINQANIQEDDSPERIAKKLEHQIGIGFDGKTFIFARFTPSHELYTINFEKSIFKNKAEHNQIEIPAKFTWQRTTSLKSGIDRLILLFNQREKLALNKANLLALINPKQDIIRENVLSIYEILLQEMNATSPNNRILTLYAEWDRVFGTLYGEESQQTDFTAYSVVIKETYGVAKHKNIDTKKYLFALQTYFNIFIKMLISMFMKKLLNPAFDLNTIIDKSHMVNLFEGRDSEQQRLVSNFFEIHFYEWFTYSEYFDINIVNSTINILSKFELTSYVLKPESMQDILQEIYMGLIPDDLRHLMGEYFSPDWAVEFVLKNIGYNGNIDSRLCDPTCGSGAFLLQAIKIILSTQKINNSEQVSKITQNIVGFDINPISAISAKANYILALLSSFYDNLTQIITTPLHIPIYISDSVLAPVVYSEQNQESLVAKTYVGEFTIPKFDTYQSANRFLDILSSSVNLEESYPVFWQQVKNATIFPNEENNTICETLYEKLFLLHHAGKNSFWPCILKNSFAPIMISDKFDYVVGNPPWISWKSMSKTYREGTLEVWQSYGIFEKSAYDKKTTHDDFGMAVTYVAIDYYLKSKGKLGFLLPASFLKSTKGGEGFRKLSIQRNGQDVPFRITQVDDFSQVKLFTIKSMAIFFEKNTPMKYPMSEYHAWSYIGKSKPKFDAHAKWSDVEQLIQSEIMLAQPISPSDIQSAWLTIPKTSTALSNFASRLLDNTVGRHYKGRKGIEPAGAKGVYILQRPCKEANGNFTIVNDMSRQRRIDILNKGEHKGSVESTHIYPMLGGRNIKRWKVESNEYILVPHTATEKYGIAELDLVRDAPLTFKWLSFYKKELFDSRVQNGKFFDPDKNPFYRLDNVGVYSFAPYKVLWKEQTGSMSAVVVGNYSESIPKHDENLFADDKVIMVDSKILFLALDNKMEAYFVCGILNSPSVRKIIDGYAVSTNRGTDVLEYLAIQKFDESNEIHKKIASKSENLHRLHKTLKINMNEVEQEEVELDKLVLKMFG